MDTTNNEAFENGYASGKIDGFKEAWELARGILYGYSNGELRDMFGISDHYDIFSFPTEDVRICFEEYKNKIKVGDVVKYGRHVGVVLQIEGNNIARVLTKSSKGNGHVIVATFPVSTLIKLVEGVESFSDILENIKYVNE